MCGVLLKHVNNLELNLHRMTIRKYLVRFFCHFDHYTLNVYQSEENFTYFCFVSRRCQDERQSNAEIYIDY